jgi:hypothetical protein
VPTDASEEHIASNFRVEKITSARNAREMWWQALNGLHGVISQKIVLFVKEGVYDIMLRYRKMLLKRKLEPKHSSVDEFFKNKTAHDFGNGLQPASSSRTYNQALYIIDTFEGNLNKFAIFRIYSAYCWHLTG